MSDSGAIGRYDYAAQGIRIGEEILSVADARARGFVRASNSVMTNEWVQADCFQVRGVFRRGDAGRFDAAELRELVMAFLADHGVEVDRPGQLEAFCFNYEPGIDLDKAREQAAADMAASVAPLKLIEQTPHVNALVHYVSHGTPPRADGSQAFRSVCRAAIVAEVNGPGARASYGIPGVTLCVLNPTGLFFQTVAYDPGTFTGPERTAKPGEGLPLITCADLEFKPGTWHWESHA